MTAKDCPTCHQLLQDWNGATTTLRQMRRSAVVWDYGPQMKTVEEKRLRYVEHQASAHPDEAPGEALPPPRSARRSHRTHLLRRVDRTRAAIAVAAIALILLAIFLHSV
ncbi:MAG: hypothetical protein ACLQRH_25690 [Acidimicrobiales bacterium]